MRTSEGGRYKSYASWCQKEDSREASSESLRAFQRRKWGVRVCAVWSSRAPQTSWRRKAPGWSAQPCRSNRRHPSSLRDGAMSARSSASRRRCWPSLARRVTTRVTAFFGSLVTVAPRKRRRADRFGALRGFRLGMSAAIVLQTVLMARRTGSIANFRSGFAGGSSGNAFGPI
jgi:hypothetical protein